MARVGILLALAAAGSLAIGTLAFVWVDSTLADNYDSLHELARLASECKVGAWTVSELRKEFRAIAHGAHPDTAIPGSAAHCSAEAVGEALTKLKRMHPDTAISFPFALAPLIGSPEEYAPRQCATYILAFLSWSLFAVPTGVLLVLRQRREGLAADQAVDAEHPEEEEEARLAQPGAARALRRRGRGNAALLCLATCTVVCNSLPEKDRVHGSLQVGFPLKHTQQVEAPEGPPCDRRCGQRKGEEVDVNIKRCVVRGWRRSSQYVYRYDDVLKLCHYHLTEIPSERARASGYGAMVTLLFMFVICFMMGLAGAFPLLIVALVLLIPAWSMTISYFQGEAE